MSLTLNCDLGESYGRWSMGLDADIMPHIQQANIACGFHAGDAQVMQSTLKLAKAHGVEIGAHPSYPDRQGFGRRSMACSADDLYSDLLYQISALDGMALCNGLTLSYVKPHGALYNDMMKSAAIRQTIMRALSDFHRPLKLMLQATPEQASIQQEASELGLPLYFEAFADRGYDDDGLLIPRGQAGALLSPTETQAQVLQLKEQGSITSHNGRSIALQADSVCVHGDNPAAITVVQALKQLLND